MNLLVISMTLTATASFGLGYMAALQNIPAQHVVTCPQVEGGVVMQTVNNQDGQICVYIPEKRVSGKTVRVTL
jgi:hypothetical protein